MSSPFLQRHVTKRAPLTHLCLVQHGSRTAAGLEIHNAFVLLPDPVAIPIHTHAAEDARHS